MMNVNPTTISDQSSENEMDMFAGLRLVLVFQKGKRNG
jgi:hypothetical protein